MYTFKIGIPAEVHDTFVKNHPLCNLLQSSSWAKVKDNWGSEIVGVYEKDTLVASSLVLIKPLPAGFTMLYTPRGPVMDYTNERLVSYFMAELKKFGKKKRALFIKMDPAVHYQDFHLGEEHQPHAEATAIIETLKKAGAKYQGLTMDMGATIQPRFQANIYREDFSEEQLSKSTKKMIKTAEKKGVVVQQGHVDFVDEFEKVIQSTMERQHISLRNSDYFKKLLNIYPEDSFIMLAQVNLKERLDSTRQRYDKNQKDLSNLKENQVKKRHNLEELDASLTRELKELEENILTLVERCVKENLDLDSKEAIELVNLHQKWIKMTWNKYSVEAHKSLAMMYTMDERFKEYYDKNVEGCTDYLSMAIENNL